MTARVKLLTILLPATAWAILWLERLHQGFSNIDDYLYAVQARAYLDGLKAGPHGLVQAWKSFATSSPMLPTVAAPLTAISHDPTLLVLIQLPLLATLFAGVVTLAHCLGASDGREWWIAAGTVAAAPVLSYAVMLHFAVAASSALVWTCAAYLRSSRFESLRWSLALGGVLGLLSLSRVVALVYLAAAAAVMLLDQVTLGTSSRVRLRNAVLASAVAFAVAAPWWATAGPSAVHYLLHAGYDDSSGFTQRTSVLATAWHRLTHTADETGWILAAALSATFLISVLQALRRRKRPTIIAGCIALLCLTGLGSSSNQGTAFALPVVVLATVVSLAWLRTRLQGLLAALALAASTVALIVPSNAISTPAHPLWLNGIPARAQEVEALGAATSRVSLTRLARDVADAVRGRRALLARDDAVLNANGLNSAYPGIDLAIPSYGAQALTAADLTGTNAAISGLTAHNYHSGLQAQAVDGQLIRAGFQLAKTFRLSPRNSVEIWLR